MPSAVDNMSPRHHFIRALQEIPVAPSITAHSIVAVEGYGPVEDGDDGVVEYSSAHIESVESELVVKSGHSTPGAIPTPSRRCAAFCGYTWARSRRWRRPGEFRHAMALPRRQRERHDGVAAARADLAVAARRDHDVLTAMRSGGTSSASPARPRAAALPELAAGLDVEGAQVVVHRGADEDEARRR